MKLANTSAATMAFAIVLLAILCKHTSVCAFSSSCLAGCIPRRTTLFVTRGLRPFEMSPLRSATSSSSVTAADSEASAASTSGEDDSEDRQEFEEAKQAVLSTLHSAIDKIDPSFQAMKEPLAHFSSEYMQACLEAYRSGCTDITSSVAAQRISKAVELAIQYGVGPNKYQFGVTHKALRGNDDDDGGLDYYKHGVDFFRPAMDLQNSLLLGLDNLKQAFDQVHRGENVIFFANHQSEADPQVMSCLLERAGFETEAADMVYVAGHKVTTDPLAIPFSMGRNLICIHSKKHIDSATGGGEKSIKQKQNLAAMSAMLDMLKTGGGISIWVAPSGGRDRRLVPEEEEDNVNHNVVVEVPLAKFDQKTVDMFRLLGNKSRVPTHYYALAMVSYNLCPPPDGTDAKVGEQRNVRFVPVGISVSEELQNVGGVESRHLFTDHTQEIVEKAYQELLSEIAKRGSGSKGEDGDSKEST